MKFTDTQLVILSSASLREDYGIELPANLKGGAARKVVSKLLFRRPCRRGAGSRFVASLGCEATRCLGMPSA